MAASSSASHSSPVLHDYGPDSGGRVKGVKVVMPVIVGNIAKYFGKKREEDGHTHQWTVFLKPYLNEDYSAFIKKVQFKLHDSYPNPTRIVTKPPYEITETGWGEFEIAVKIHFNDPVERPVTIYHLLRLFEVSKDPTAQPIIKKTMSAETYDEIVFQEPTRLMISLLDSVKPTKQNWKPETDIEAKKKAALASITQARSLVKNEIEMLKNKLKLSRETIDSFKTQLVEAQAQQPNPFAFPAPPPHNNNDVVANATATAVTDSNVTTLGDNCNNEVAIVVSNAEQVATTAITATATQSSVSDTSAPGIAAVIRMKTEDSDK